MRKGLSMVVVVCCSLCCSVSGYGQDIYVSRDASISFFSSAPIEDIQAKTDKAVSAINLETGAVFFKVPVQSFQFERELMQEHFNSDYLESDKYPYAEFRGKIRDIPALTTDGTYPVTVDGQLTIHGVPKAYQGPGTIEVKDGQITAVATFQVRLADHHIKIPSILSRNIAEVVKVSVDAAYKPQKEAGSPPQKSTGSTP
ncbi:MAG TPA: YceI family protein [Chitinophagaceae bacterium]|nr:YceI family protein [Chitinophagaceae bacterium]